MVVSWYVTPGNQTSATAASTLNPVRVGVRVYDCIAPPRVEVRGQPQVFVLASTLFKDAECSRLANPKPSRDSPVSPSGSLQDRLLCSALCRFPVLKLGLTLAQQTVSH